MRRLRDNSVTAALIEASFEIDLPAHRIAKVLRHRLLVQGADLLPVPQPRLQQHHRRMPSVTAGAAIADRDLVYIGISAMTTRPGSGSGQFCHAVRRRLNMT